MSELIKIIPDAPDEVREAVSRLKTNSIFVVNIGVNRANITDKNWIYYLEKEFSFIRVSFPFNQSDNVAPKGTSSISAEIAYGNDNLLPTSKEMMADLVIKQLISANVIDSSDEIIYLEYWTYDIMIGGELIKMMPEEFLRRINDEEDFDGVEKIPE